MTTAVMTRAEVGARTVDQTEPRASVDEILNRHPAVGFALAVVRNGSFDSSDVGSRTSRQARPSPRARSFASPP